MIPSEPQDAIHIRDFLVELCADLAPDFFVIDGWAAEAHERDVSMSGEWTTPGISSEPRSIQQRKPVASLNAHHCAAGLICA